MERGLVFNIQRYSVEDGPGIRTTVFLKGCPLRCAWCHNPEGISAGREIYFVETLCVGCGECRRACPREAMSPAEPGRPLAPRVEGCELCGACADACPAHARRIVGQEMTVAQVIDLVLRDRVFFEDSGGGVTFSGGEPLLQPRFLRGLLKAFRTQGIHTTVDTSGLAPFEDLLSVAPLVDLFLYDVKLMDQVAHERYTGASNRLILENLERLGRVHSQIWVRVPYLPGVNDRRSDMERLARFAASIGGVRQVSLLPYHRAGSQKHARIGNPDPGMRLKPPSEEALDQAAEIFQQVGLTARTAG